MDSPNKLQNYKSIKSTKVQSTHNSARLQILHGSSFGLSNQMTEYKSTKCREKTKYKKSKNIIVFKYKKHEQVQKLQQY